jgi:hypothetical protein
VKRKENVTRYGYAWECLELSDLDAHSGGQVNGDIVTVQQMVREGRVGDPSVFLSIVVMKV